MRKFNRCINLSEKLSKDFVFFSLSLSSHALCMPWMADYICISIVYNDDDLKGTFSTFEMHNKAATHVNYPDCTYAIVYHVLLVHWAFNSLSHKTRIDWKVLLPVSEFNRQQIIPELDHVPHFMHAEKSISSGQEQHSYAFGGTFLHNVSMSNIQCLWIRFSVEQK